MEFRNRVDRVAEMFERIVRPEHADFAVAKTALLQHVASKPNPDVGLLADLHEQIRAGEQRLTAIREEAVRIKARVFTQDDVADALREFDQVWESLNTREKCRVLQLLIERVDYDGAAGTIAVTFCPNGIKAFQNDFLKKDRQP